MVAVKVAALVITGVGGFMVKVKSAVPEPEALVAFRVTRETPGEVGVPVMAPVVALMLNPAGKPEAE